jgi:uncharacterized Zn-binding protein involved in type VI secretion
VSSKKWGDIMPGIAINGSEIVESIKPDHVTYDIYDWQQISPGYCREYDEDGHCIDYVSPTYGWVFTGTGSTNAKITGTVTTNSKMKIGGVSVATVGDVVNETWVADPPVPSNTSTREYRNISPGTSGSGQGVISSGSSKMKLVGKAVALIGSEVTTHLGTMTTIKNGNTKINAPS